MAEYMPSERNPDAIFTGVQASKIAFDLTLSDLESDFDMSAIKCPHDFDTWLSQKSAQYSDTYIIGVSSFAPPKWIERVLRQRQHIKYVSCHHVSSLLHISIVITHLIWVLLVSGRPPGRWPGLLPLEEGREAAHHF
jgi:hypothetical protein